MYVIFKVNRYSGIVYKFLRTRIRIHIHIFKEI